MVTAKPVGEVTEYDVHVLYSLRDKMVSSTQYVGQCQCQGSIHLSPSPELPIRVFHKVKY